MKKRAYESRLREVEHSTFTPLVFSATGGMSHEATVFYKRLASLLSQKWKEPYAAVLGWIRCHLSFCLLHSAIQCIRGVRSSQGHFVKCSPALRIRFSNIVSLLHGIVQSSLVCLFCSTVLQTVQNRQVCCRSGKKLNSNSS